VELLRAIDPTFAERLGYYQSHVDKLRDTNELLARSWALADCLQERVAPTGSADGREGPPPLLAALAHLERTLATIARLESRFDRTKHMQIRAVWTLMELVADLLVDEVHPDRLEGAFQRLDDAINDVATWRSDFVSKLKRLDHDGAAPDEPR
jgi:hypothetical protein